MARILITGTSSGFGAMAAEALARAGHHVFASMRDPAAHGGDAANHIASLAALGFAIEALPLDVTVAAAVQGAVDTVLARAGGIDVLIHNAGHMVFGPAEAFTPEQLGAVYDINVLGTQRLNRAVLPHMRAARHGLVLWVGSTSTRGGTPPWLAPYFAAKAAMDSLAQSYALELARFGIETSILVPGAFTSGTQHFATAGHPADAACAQAYVQGPYADLAQTVLNGLAALEPPQADPTAVAREIVRIIALPHGQRPFRVHIDPSDDGAEVVNAVADRVRAQLLERIGLTDLLRPQLSTKEDTPCHL